MSVTLGKPQKGSSSSLQIACKKEGHTEAPVKLDKGAHSDWPLPVRMLRNTLVQ